MRHARENPELYENPNYSLADDLYRQADETRDANETSGDKPRPNQETPVIFGPVKGSQGEGR